MTLNQTEQPEAFVTGTEPDGLLFPKPLFPKEGTRGPITPCAPVTVSSAAFPRPLDPVDDLPPATVITSVGTLTQGKLIVRGVTTDNGAIKRVLVNGHEAHALAPNFAEWEITLDRVHPGALKLTAYAEDSAGNTEKLPHQLSIVLSRSGR